MNADPLAEVFRILHRQGRLTGERAQALRTAYGIAAQAHAGTKRASGDPYITHPVKVAEIAADWPLPFSLLPAALLHDVTDPTAAEPVALESLRGRVDDEVIDLVKTENNLQAQKDLFASGVTTLAVALKVADRLHNARTWDYIPPAKALRRAQETLDLIAPAAAAVALPQARDELLRLSLKRLRPERDQRTGSRGPRTYGSGERLTQSLMYRAVDSLPARLRHRYAEEWAADLATLSNPRQRLLYTLGLQYSARRMAAF